jgi:hypothetical protein
MNAGELPEDTPSPEPNINDTARIDPQTGLPLPDPYTEYLTCPHCGTPEVEVFCYQTEVACYQCGKIIPHTPPITCGVYPFCKRGQAPAEPK